MSDRTQGRGFVDWGTAERVGLLVAGEGPQRSWVRQEDVDRASDETVALVRDYTHLEPRGEIPRPEAIDRREWVRVNLAAIRHSAAELEGRLAASLDAPGPLGPAARAAAGLATGVEAGLAIGYMGRRVLGQYEVALIGPARPSRLLFVAPNLTEAEDRLGGPDRDLFLRWIAMHEATHALQFEAVPWLRDHVGGMVERLLRGASLRPELRDLGAAARRALADPRRLAESLRESGLVGILAGPRQLELVRSVQATMTVIEGYSEHVMDAIGERLDPSYARLRRLADAQRERQSLLDSIVARLLGLDMKLRQYQLGKRFADRVAEQAGIEGLNEVWRSADALPDSSELERPELWLRRVAAA
ncbi:MAG TPA: zinc-dependent metalloprotease [Solirubrobacterales bacterium]|nr:zinc-dependent metalloprotease [Solirubrobacterales bacterium]